METGKLSFNKDRDLREVDQFGYIDLVEAFNTNTIPASVGIDDLEYNGIEDPSTIIGKPVSIFDAIDRQQGIMKNGTAASQAGSHESESGD